MFGVVKCLRVHVLSMLASFVSLHAHMLYMLVVLIYLTCSRAYVYGVFVCPICFIFNKLNSKNSDIEKFVLLTEVFRMHLKIYDGVFLQKING